jgi:hypothetical protein
LAVRTVMDSVGSMEEDHATCLFDAQEGAVFRLAFLIKERF